MKQQELKVDFDDPIRALEPKDQIEQIERRWLLQAGFTPRLGDSGWDSHGERTRSDAAYWSATVFGIALLIFGLIMLKGWPGV